jgi:hypothetical protein
MSGLLPLPADDNVDWFTCVRAQFRAHMGGGMKRALYAIGLAALTLAAGTAAVRGLRAPALRGAAAGEIAPVWTATKWPFLLDQWGIGKAWVCDAADCGARIEVFVRPKIGFCNCTTGVADDIELERVADTDLVSSTVQPAGPSRPVDVGSMHGLARAYEVSATRPGDRVLSVAFNNGCDVVVALAALGKADPVAAMPAIVAFLNSAPVLQWVRQELGLEAVRREG